MVEREFQVCAEALSRVVVLCFNRCFMKSRLTFRCAIFPVPDWQIYRHHRDDRILAAVCHIGVQGIIGLHIIHAQSDIRIVVFLGSFDARFLSFC